MRAVDTNILVSLATRDDATQVARAEAFIAHGAWVPHLVLTEAMWILRSVYDRRPGEIASAVEILLNHEHLTLQAADAVAAAVAIFRKRSALGFSDCLVLEVAAKPGTCPSARSTGISEGLPTSRRCESAMLQTPERIVSGRW